MVFAANAAEPKPAEQASNAEDVLLEKLETLGVDSIVLHKLSSQEKKDRDIQRKHSIIKWG